MAKNMIIEAQDSSLVYENGQKGVLGKLAGIFANYKVGTRNGGRLYNEELIDKRIFGNEDVMEALQTRTLFGELDHPEGDRCETLAQNAAVSIVKLEKNEEKGVVEGEALILDTPSGRTLKALVDSGATMGISSRGIGEEIMQNGQVIIDPDTYDFITFDIVVTPANKDARLSLVEGKQRDTKLYKSIEKEIKECESLNQLDQLKRVIESQVSMGKFKLNKLIENKIATLTEAVEDISAKEDEDINSDKDITQTSSEEVKSEENLVPQEPEVLDEVTTEEQDSNDTYNNELLESNASLMTENKNLVERLARAEKAYKLLQRKVVESRTAESNLKSNLSEVKKSSEETLRKVKKINESKQKRIENFYKTEVEELKTKLAESESKNSKLVESNKSLGQKAAETYKKYEEATKNLGEITSKLEENKSLLEQSKNQVKLLENKLNDAEASNKAKLEESRKVENNKVSQLEAKLEEANQRVTQLTEANQRISRLPFSTINANLQFNGEASSINIDPEEQDLVNAMVGMFTKK